MTGWLLEHQAAVQFYLWLAAFGGIALWESFQPRRMPGTATAARWSRNMALAACELLIARFFLPLSGVAVAVWTSQQSWGLLNVVPAPFWLSFLVGVVAMDLANYALHRLCHAVPWLWRLHKIHHSDLDFDCSTGLRHHPLEYLLLAGAMLLLIAAIGVPPLAVMIAATLELAAAAFNHGNVALPEALDRILRRFVVTPDMHRIHHSALQWEGNRNFGNAFPWWDRLFSTYQISPRTDHRRMELGLAEARAPEDVTLGKLLLLPFRAAPRIASA